MLGSKSFVLLSAVLIVLVSDVFSGVVVPREIQDFLENEEGPSGAAPEETNKPEDADEKDSSLFERRRRPSFGNPPLGGDKSFPGFDYGFEPMPPLKPKDYEFPDYGRPEVLDYDYDRRNPDRDEKQGGLPSSGRGPSNIPRVPSDDKNRGRPFGGKEDERRRIPSNDKDFPFGGKGDDEIPRIPSNDRDKDFPFGGKGDDEGPRIPNDGKGKDFPFGAKGDDEGPRIPNDDKGKEFPFGGKDDDESPHIPSDDEEKGFDEDMDNEIGGKEDKGSDEDAGKDGKGIDEDSEKDEKGIDDDSDHDIGKDSKEGTNTDDEEKHDEEEGENPDIKGDEDNEEGGKSEEKGDKPSEEEDHIPEEEEKGMDEVETGIDQDEGKDTDQGKDESDSQPFNGGFVFDTPFFNVRQVSKYFETLEKALEQVFRQTMEEASLLNGTYANSTEEEVDVDGQKYVVQKSIIKAGDNNSSIFVEAMSSVPESNGSKMVFSDKLKAKKVKTD